MDNFPSTSHGVLTGEVVERADGVAINAVDGDIRAYTLPPLVPPLRAMPPS